MFPLQDAKEGIFWSIHRVLSWDIGFLKAPTTKQSKNSNSAFSWRMQQTAKRPGLGNIKVLICDCKGLKEEREISQGKGELQE